MSRAVESGRAFVRFALEDKELSEGLKRIQGRLKTAGKTLQKFGKIGAAVGGTVTAVFGAAVKQFTSVGDALDKMAARTGLTVEALSELSFAAEQSGASGELLEKGVRGLQNTLRNAERGGKRAADNFGALGLSFADLKNLSPEEQLKAVADGLAGVEDDSKRAALAMGLMGGAGQKLLPLLSGGAAGMEALQAEARELGLTVDTETAASAAKLGDAMNIVSKVLNKVVVEVGASVAPMLTSLATTIGENTSRAIAFIKENRELVAVVGAGAAALTAGGTAAVVLGSALNQVAGAVRVLNTAALVLAANPVALTVGAVAAAAGTLAFHAYRASTATDRLVASTRELAEANDARRQQDQAAADRLAVLASKQELTNAEVSEAKTLAEQLTDGYGDLGLEIDAATGKIDGMADAQERLNGLMREQALRESAAEYAALQQQLARLTELEKRARSTTSAILQAATPAGLLGFSGADRVSNLGDQARETRRRMAEIRGRMDALRGGGPAVSPADVVPAHAANPGVVKAAADTGEKVGTALGQKLVDAMRDMANGGASALTDLFDFAGQGLTDLRELGNSLAIGTTAAASRVLSTRGVTNVNALQALAGGGDDQMLQESRQQTRLLKRIEEKPALVSGP
ncbi:MAG: hypothetical protein AAGA92_14090 [Planctomycetota bacterium]